MTEQPQAEIASAARGRLTKARKRRRDAAILRRWRDGWAGKKIAEHLAVKPSVVSNVVHANGAARKPRGKRITVAIEDAPVAAWRQVILPELEQVAAALGMSGGAKHALVFLGLLWRKPFDDIAAFQRWVCQVTGYQPAKIAAFVEHASQNFLIVDGRLNHDAFATVETDGETGQVELVLMAEVLRGRFLRTANGEYALSQATA